MRLLKHMAKSREQEERFWFRTDKPTKRLLEKLAVKLHESQATVTRQAIRELAERLGVKP